MIEFTKAYRVGDKTFATISAAQIAALVALGLPENVASVIVTKAAEVAAILSTQEAKPARKPRKPRSDIGKKRAEAPSTPATAAA